MYYRNMKKDINKLFEILQHYFWGFSVQFDKM